MDKFAEEGLGGGVLGAVVGNLRCELLGGEFACSDARKQSYGNSKVMRGLAVSGSHRYVSRVGRLRLEDSMKGQNTFRARWIWVASRGESELRWLWLL